MTDREQAWDELLRLTQEGLPPREFWQRYASLSLRATGVSAAAVLYQRGQEPWRAIASAMRGGTAPARASAQTFLQEAPELAAQYFAGEVPAHAVLAKIPTRQRDEACVLLLMQNGQPTLSEQARSLAGLPVAYEASHALQQVEGEVAKLTSLVDSVLVTNAAEKSGASSLALCNALANTFRCDRVSLGWQEGGYCQLQSMSRTEQFDRKMALVQKIETAMDECLDQGEEITFPSRTDGPVARDHTSLAQELRGANLLSLPVRQEMKVVGVLTCERASAPFSEADISALRLTLDASAARLVLLRQRDRWWGVKLREASRQALSGLLGPRHTLAKLVAILMAVLLMVLFFWRVEYRVEGTFLLRSDQAATLSSPFEGFIKEVLVESGNKVTAGQPMLRLDTEPLRVDESSSVAELDRFQSEADKARAAKAPAEMRIAEAMARQAQAKLDVIRYQLAQAEVKAPLDGVIIEGDLKERLAAPVKQGDALFRIAQLGKLYVEFQIDERDAHLINAGAVGEAAFVSQPAQKIPVQVEFMVPAAMEREGSHAFAGKARFQAPEQDWWRPGMSGICKINAGQRSLFWILTHRTVDFLRLKLWW